MLTNKTLGTVCKLVKFSLKWGERVCRELAPLAVSAAEGLHGARLACSSHARPEVCSVFRIPRDDLHSTGDWGAGSDAGDSSVVTPSLEVEELKCVEVRHTTAAG